MLTRRQQLELKNVQKETAEPDPKAKAKSKAKAKGQAKGKAKSKAKAKNQKPTEPGDEDKQDEPEEEQDGEQEEKGQDKTTKEPVKPKAKAARKAKAKANSKKRTREEAAEMTRRGRVDDDGEELVDTSMVTPKKRLFQDEKELFLSPVEEAPDGVELTEEEKKQNHLARIQHELVPKPVRDARKQSKVDEVPADPEASARAGKGGRGGKGRGRGRGKGLKSPNVKVPISPSIKKEKVRRARKTKTPTANEDLAEMNDDGLQKRILKILKPVDALTFETLREHLRGKEGSWTTADLSVYWSRAACGVRWLQDPAKPQVAYFAIKHQNVTQYNLLMTLSHQAAVFMVSFLKKIQIGSNWSIIYSQTSSLTDIQS